MKRLASCQSEIARQKRFTFLAQNVENHALLRRRSARKRKQKGHGRHVEKHDTNRRLGKHGGKIKARRRAQFPRLFDKRTDRTFPLFQDGRNGIRVFL